MALPDDLAVAVRLGGEMGTRVAAFDWNAHPLGPIEHWDPSVRTVVAMALVSRFPIVVWIGPELSVLYNDGYSEMLGDKHPQSLGGAGADVWWEIWDVIGPMLRGVVDTGVATWSDDQLLMLMRHGFLEECYFTFTYSAIVGGGGAVEGVFCAVNETTSRVLSERRLALLRRLADAAQAARSTTSVADAALRTCTDAPDLPFVALYLVDERGERASMRLHAAVGNVGKLLMAEPVSPLVERLRASDCPFLVDDLHEWVPGMGAIVGNDEPTRALAVPLTDATSAAARGWLLCGLSPRLAFDDAYRAFLDLLGEFVASALSSAEAYETERDRAEALTELDRAKTAFFSNVSHEFRTPLTLMLAPLEDALADGARPLAAGQRERVTIAHANGLRMLKLVNSLLDFARIEAGRMEARYRATDLSAVTADLVSVFDSAYAAAGVTLSMELHDIDDAADTDDVYVDVDMWERIVLNLLSNALKYTAAGGRVDVRLRRSDDRVELVVADTGIGIPSDELPRLFERFHRGRNTSGRSLEGTGIGLALVAALVRLHGGEIDVRSELGAGSTFTVRLPRGRAHLPAEHIVTETRPTGSPHAASFVAEALRWLPDETRSDTGTDTETDDVARPRRNARILVVDDNADMRRYMAATLAVLGEVETATNGRDALAQMRRRRPDVVVSDVMMPELDGIAMLRELRADPALRDVPTIVVSARAGREAAVSGLADGADDYVVKPFTASELLARVRARLDAVRRAGRSTTHAFDALLTEVTDACLAARDTDAVADAVAAFSAQRLGIVATVIAVCEDGAPTLRLHRRWVTTRRRSIDVDRITLDADHPATAPIRDGETLLMTGAAARARFGERTPESDAPPGGALAAVELVDPDGASLGTMVLEWPDAFKFDHTAIEAIHRLAKIVARAVERVRMVERDRAVSDTLQRSLLTSPAQILSVVHSNLYQAGVAATDVGGDWYDLFDLGAGRLGVAIGDVVGRGLAAAATMGQLRAALRVAAAHHDGPYETLAALDRFAAPIDDARASTVGYAIVDTATAEVTYMRAGHLPAMLVEPDGTTRLLEDGRSWPLGTRGVLRDAPSGVAAFAPGSLLLLYTDGLVERRRESLDVGFGRLADSLARHWRLPVHELVARVEADLHDDDVQAHDDTAIIAVRSLASVPGVFTDAIPADPGAEAAMRERLRDWLRAEGVDRDTTDSLVLAIGEACANAVDHGCGRDATQVVTIEVGRDGDELVACVHDDGGRRSRRGGSLGGEGRGTAIIRAMVDDVDIRADHNGTTVVLRTASARHLVA